MAKNYGLDEAIKRPNSKNDYNEKNLLELFKCIDDPLYFMKNFMKIQHPTRGALPFDPYPYQIKMIEAFKNYRNVVSMCARQLGKCSTFNTLINVSGNKQKIGSLVQLTSKERIVSFLENLLIKLS